MEALFAATQHLLKIHEVTEWIYVQNPDVHLDDIDEAYQWTTPVNLIIEGAPDVYVWISKKK